MGRQRGQAGSLNGAPPQEPSLVSVVWASREEVDRLRPA